MSSRDIHIIYNIFNPSIPSTFENSEFRDYVMLYIPNYLSYWNSPGNIEYSPLSSKRIPNARRFLHGNLDILFINKDLICNTIMEYWRDDTFSTKANAQGKIKT